MAASSSCPQGGKNNVFEGGTRTPFIASWPAQIPAGTVSDEMVTTIDFATSLAKLANVEVPADAFLDSFDVLDALLAKPGAKGREYVFQQDNGTGNYGFRVGKWKLLRLVTGGSTNVYLRRVRTPQKRLQLYDLEQDPGESNDLSESNPELVQELNRKITEIVDAGRTRK